MSEKKKNVAAFSSGLGRRWLYQSRVQGKEEKTKNARDVLWPANKNCRASHPPNSPVTHSTGIQLSSKGLVVGYKNKRKGHVNQIGLVKPVVVQTALSSSPRVPVLVCLSSARHLFISKIIGSFSIFLFFNLCAVRLASLFQCLSVFRGSRPTKYLAFPTVSFSSGPSLILGQNAIDLHVMIKEGKRI